MARNKVRIGARRVVACVMALLLVAGLVPALPEAPYALAEEPEAALEIGADGGLGVDEDPGTSGEPGDAEPEGGLDEDAEAAILGELELVAQELYEQGSGEEQGLEVVGPMLPEVVSPKDDGVPAPDEVEDADLGVEVQATGVSVSNPRVRADSSMNAGQVVTWDCVWFGSYPQTEVTPFDAAYASLASAGWDANGNAAVNEVRYYRIKQADATPRSYWQSVDDAYRYFRYEPVKWRVLKVNGSKALVVADKALDNQYYNTSWRWVTWETSSIRSWLNGYDSSSNQSGINFTDKCFLTRVFSESERLYIVPTNVIITDNDKYINADGNDITDKVFLLSETEICNPVYGYVPDYTIYDEARLCRMTDYANVMREWTYKSDGNQNNCRWCLSLPSNQGAGFAACVNAYGSVELDGTNQYDNDYAVRPAMNIDLTSPYIQTAGTVSSNGDVNEQAPTGTGGNTGGDTGGGTGGGGSGGGGGSSVTVKSTTMKLGSDASGNVSNGDALKFFPGDWSAKSTFVPVEYSVENNDDGSVTYKLGVGIGRKDLLDKKETWNQFKANVEDAKKSLIRYDALCAFAKGKWGAGFATEGFKAVPKLGVMGYGEFTYKDGRLVSKAGSLVAEAKWEARADWWFLTPIGPTYLELAGGVKAKMKGKVSFEQSTSATSLDGSLSAIPNVSLEGGYGVASVATIGVQGSAEVPIQIAPPTKGEFEAKASLHAYLVFVIDWTYDLAKFHTTLWDTTGGASVQSDDTAVTAQSDGAWETGTFSEVDRSYAEGTTEWMGGTEPDGVVVQSDGVGDVSFVSLQRSVMPNMLPRLAQAGGRKVMVFQQNDPERATLNSSVLAYSVFDGGAWSAPAPVWDTGTLDAYADLQAVGDDLYVVWQKEKSKLSGDVSGDAQGVMAGMAAASEVCVARFDAGTGTFVDAQYVTSNDVLDMMPVLVEGTATPQVAFVRNTANALDQSEGSTQVVLATKSGSAWAESVLAEPSRYVSEVAASQAGGQAQVAYSTIDSGTGSSAARGSVVLAGTGTTISDGDEQPSALQWEDGVLYWNSDGLLRAYDAASGEARTLNESLLAGIGEDGTTASSGAAVGDSMRVLREGARTSVVWTSTDSDKTESRVLSAVVGEDGALSDAVELFSGGIGISASDAVLDTDGTYAMVANTYDTTGTHDLAYARLGGCGSLQTLGASAYASEDGQVAVTYGFQNNSERPVNGYVVTVRRGTAVVDRRTYDDAVAPGATVAGDLSFALDANGSELTVEVSPKASGDVPQGTSAKAAVTTDEDLAQLSDDFGPARITALGLGTTAYTYDGKAKEPGVTVRAGDEVVPAGCYGVSYKNNVNAGTATVTVTGKGGYEGTLTATFTIRTASVGSAQVTGIKERAYTGKARTQSPTVKVGGRTLKKGTDYKLSYKDNTKVGTATMTVTGTGNYKGTVKTTFKIVKAANPMRVKAVTRTAKAAATKKRAVVVAAPLKLTKKAQGKVTYKKAGGSKYLSVSKTTGKVTVKKGTEKGTYKVKIKVTAAGNANYKKASKTVTCTVVVK